MHKKSKIYKKESNREIETKWQEGYNFRQIERNNTESDAAVCSNESGRKHRRQRGEYL